MLQVSAGQLLQYLGNTGSMCGNYCIPTQCMQDNHQCYNSDHWHNAAKLIFWLSNHTAQQTCSKY